MESQPRPFLPGDHQDRERRAKVFARAAFALCLRELDPEGPTAAAIAEQRWERLSRIAAVTRAATDPNTTGDTSALLAEAFSDFLGSLAPVAAGPQLMSRGVDFGTMIGTAAMNIPWVTNPPALSWIAEGDPMAIADATSSSLAVTPKFAAVAVVLSQKLLRSSNAEAIFTRLLQNAVTRALDGALFTSTAGSAIRPTGLLNGVSPVASTGSLADDLRLLTDTIVANGGGQDVIFVTSPGRALAAAVKSFSPLPIYGSAAVAESQLVAVDAAGFFFSVAPEIRSSTTSTLHMDTAPLPLVDDHGTLATPVRDMFQTASIALSAELWAGWAVAPGCVAIIEDPSW
jgi:hypothetical protein